MSIIQTVRHYVVWQSMLNVNNHENDLQQTCKYW
jgi:hypothetical protein